MSRTASALLLFILATGLFAACAPEDRDARFAALARWEDRRLAPADSLATFLGAGDPLVRRAALRTAGLIGRTEPLPDMIERLDDTSQAVRAQAAFSLGQLGGDVAVALLIDALDDPHQSVRVAVLEGLAHQEHDGSMLYAPALSGTTREARAAWTALRNVAGRADHDSLVAAIGAGLGRTENEVRWRVLRCAELAPDSALVDQIASFVVDHDVQVRVHALRAIGRQSGGAALAAVLRSNERHGRLKGRDLRRVQIAELRALGRLAGPVLAADREGDHTSPAGRASAVMVRGAQDSDPQVSRTALVAMTTATADLDLPEEAVHQESLLPVWRIRLARAARQRLVDPAPAVRGAACEALGALRRQGVQARLEALLIDPEPMVVAAAVRSLVRLDLEAEELGPLCRTCAEAEPAVQVALLAALADLWPETAPLETDRAAEALLAAQAGLRSGDFTVRTTAAILLSRFPGPPTIHALSEAYEAAALLAEGRADVQLEIIKAWQHLDENGAALADTSGEDIAAILRQTFDDPDLRLRLAARDCAEATELLRPELIPGVASLRETLPPTARAPRQPPMMAPYNSSPRVRCITDRGSFVIELDTAVAPNTCATFLALVEAGFHQDLTFHRVVPDFVVQGGCPRGDGWGGAGWTIRSEWSRRFFERGTVGIAHSGKDTGGSQWFVCHTPQPHLNGRYTIFGTIVSGMNVVDQIEPGDRYRLEFVNFK